MIFIHALAAAAEFVAAAHILATVAAVARVAAIGAITIAAIDAGSRFAALFA